MPPIKNNRHGTFPIFAHAPGRMEYNPDWNRIEAWSRKISPQRLPQDLSVATFNNGAKIGHNGKSLGAFESSMKGIPVSVLGGSICQWKNRDKIGLLASWLHDIDTKYVLVSDSSDVLLIGDIQQLIPKFLGFRCGGVFNAEKLFWPPGLEHIEKFENQIQSREPLYLNAGLWMAERSFAIEIIKECRSVKFESNSEQFYYKFAYQKLHPAIQIDRDCEIFQGLNRIDCNDLFVPDSPNR